MNRNEIIDKKIKRILSKCNVEKGKPVSAEAFDLVCKKFTEALIMEKKEYKIIRNQIEVANDEIQEYIEKIKESQSKLANQSKLAGIGEMAASMSHEINSPLMIINMCVEELKMIYDDEKFKEETKIEVNTIFGNIEDTVVRLSKIIKGLKRISRDSEDLNISKQNIVNIVKETFLLCDKTFQQKSIKINIEIENDHMFSKVDEINLSQTIFNLLQNAFHATENLSKSEKWINVSILTENNRNVIYVENGGDNISKDIVDKIFDPFFTTKNVDKGTGLGLSICKKSIESFKGTLDVDQSKKYPSFKITLPKA